MTQLRGMYRTVVSLEQQTDVSEFNRLHQR